MEPGHIIGIEYIMDNGDSVYAPMLEEKHLITKPIAEIRMVALDDYGGVTRATFTPPANDMETGD